MRWLPSKQTVRSKAAAWRSALAFLDSMERVGGSWKIVVILEARQEVFDLTCAFFGLLLVVGPGCFVLESVNFCVKLCSCYGG